jgi:hypothetical protein
MVPKTCFNPCLLCGRDAPQPIAVRKGYPIVRCGGCGLIYVHPRPPEEDLPGLYGSIMPVTAGTRRAGIASWGRSFGKRPTGSMH